MFNLQDYLTKKFNNEETPSPELEPAGPAAPGLPLPFRTDIPAPLTATPTPPVQGLGAAGPAVAAAPTAPVPPVHDYLFKKYGFDGADLDAANLKKAQDADSVAAKNNRLGKTFANAADLMLQPYNIRMPEPVGAPEDNVAKIDQRRQALMQALGVGKSVRDEQNALREQDMADSQYADLQTPDSPASRILVELANEMAPAGMTKFGPGTTGAQVLKSMPHLEKYYTILSAKLAKQTERQLKKDEQNQKLWMGAEWEVAPEYEGKVGFTDSQRTAFTKKNAATKAISAAAQDLESTLRGGGAVKADDTVDIEVLANSPALRSKASALHTALAMQVKNAFELGALSGPDMELIHNALGGNPANWEKAIKTYFQDILQKTGLPPILVNDPLVQARTLSQRLSRDVDAEAAGLGLRRRQADTTPAAAPSAAPTAAPTAPPPAAKPAAKAAPKAAAKPAPANAPKAEALPPKPDAPAPAGFVWMYSPRAGKWGGVKLENRASRQKEGWKE